MNKGWGPKSAERFLGPVETEEILRSLKRVKRKE